MPTFYPLIAAAVLAICPGDFNADRCTNIDDLHFVIASMPPHTMDDVLAVIADWECVEMTVSYPFWGADGIVAGNQAVTAANNIPIVAGGLCPWSNFRARATADQATLQQCGRIHGRNAANSAAGGNAADLGFTPMYFGGYVRWDSTPNDNRLEFFRELGSGTSAFRFARTAARKIALHDVDDAETDAETALSTNATTNGQLYYVEGVINFTAGGAYELSIYSVSFTGWSPTKTFIETMSGTANFNTGASATRMQVGDGTVNHSNTGIDQSFDSWWVSSTDLRGMNLVNFGLLAKSDTATSAASWAASDANADKSSVLRVTPADNVKRLANSAAGSAGDSYIANCQTRADISVPSGTLTVLAVAPVICTHDSGGASSATFQTIFLSGATRTDHPSTGGVGYAPGTSALVHARGLFYETDPATGIAWVESALDTLGVGAEWVSGDGASATYGGVQVLAVYTAAAAAGGGGNQLITRIQQRRRRRRRSCS